MAHSQHFLGLVLTFILGGGPQGHVGFQGGVDAPIIKCREASEAGADGAVGKFQNKVRFAEIYKDASRGYQPPRLRAIWETLMRAATPP